jgi:hypothetical protein
MRTVYQNLATNPDFKGISIINSSGDAASGPLVDYLKANLDSIVLQTVNRVFTTKDIAVDTHESGGATSYYNDNLLGLKTTLPNGQGNDT